jgi:tetratricopeptide (TPR) repeat protein
MTVIAWFVALIMAAAQGTTNTPQRFDYLVRADFFAGFAGDEARFKRAMEICEQTLAENPKHAEALVWHGSGLLMQSGAAFLKSDIATGRAWFDRGLKEMNDAVELAPDNVAVLIPRAATLFEATKNMPVDVARPLLQSAVSHYKHVLEIQAPIFSTLGDHPKGELLFGLAEGSARLGDLEKARNYFERLTKDAPTSGQVPKARQWIETGTLPASKGPSCVGCHK